MFNVLITAGGTREDIDPVRGITNYATGKLGSLIADRFIQGGSTVTYICSKTSVLPSCTTGQVKIITIQSTNQLQKAIKHALNEEKYDCVIHSMAVSDYAPVDPPTKKISSNEPYITITLKRLPKVINIIKQIQPDTLLVGFKLLSNACEEDLIQAAHKQIQSAGSDYVLANLLEDIDEDKHKAILINKTGIVAHGKTKQEIAEIIFNEVCI